MCFDFDDFFDLEVEDFAIIGGTIGYFEEEVVEKKRIEKEIEEEEQSKEEETYDPSADDPIP